MTVFAKKEKKCKTTIPFGYDIKKKFNISKKTREKLGLDFTPACPVKFSQMLKIPNVKKVMAKRSFFHKNKKK